MISIFFEFPVDKSEFLAAEDGINISSLFLFVISLSLDACGPPPTFEAMELIGKPKPFYKPGEYANYRCKVGWEYVYLFTTSTYCEQNNSWLPITDWACESK